MDDFQGSQNLQSNQIKSTSNRYISKKTMLLIALLLLVVIVVICYLIITMHDRQKINSMIPGINSQSYNKQQNNSGMTGANSQLSDKQQYDSIMSQARNSETKLSYLTSAVALTNYANQTQNSDNKFNALIEAATQFGSAREYQKSLDIFKQTEQIKGVTFTECNGAGLMAAALGEKQTAIFYYQKCIDLMPANYPGYQSGIQWFKNRIALLSK